MSTVIEQLNNEGVQLFLRGKIGSAKEKYNLALEKEPKHTTTLNNLGILALQEKEYKKAIEFFKKAIEEKEHSTYFLNLGHVYANMNNQKLAEEAYHRSLDLNSKSIGAWKSLASLYQFQGRYRAVSYTHLTLPTIA